MTVLWLADVYVRVSVLQQNKVLKTKRTDVVRRSVCPSFNESFSFRMPPSVVDVCSVSITVLQRHSTLLRGSTPTLAEMSVAFDNF